MSGPEVDNGSSAWSPTEDAVHRAESEDAWPAIDNPDEVVLLLLRGPAPCPICGSALPAWCEHRKRARFAIAGHDGPECGDCGASIDLRVAHRCEDHHEALTRLPAAAPLAPDGAVLAARLRAYGVEATWDHEAGCRSLSRGIGPMSDPIIVLLLANLDAGRSLRWAVDAARGS